MYAWLLAFLVVSMFVLMGLVGRVRFRARVTREVATLFSDSAGGLGPDYLAVRWATLPAPARRYLRYAVGKDTPAIHSVRLRHDGFFRTKPGQRWFPIRGEEYFTVDKPGFVWIASIQPAPLLWIEARDCLLSGRGNMLVRFNSTITLADARGAEIDQGARLRWLAEVVWFPYGFLGERIHWEPIDDSSARVTLLAEALPVRMVVEVDEEGKLVRIRGDRYRALGDGSEVLTPWMGRCADYRDFNGFRVPSSVEILWDLPDGEFCYARFRVTTLEYNIPERF